MINLNSIMILLIRKTTTSDSIAYMYLNSIMILLIQN